MASALRSFTTAALFLLAVNPIHGQDLAEYFGFDGLEVIRIGRSAGPVSLADMDDDGRTDLLVVNNHASRIEIHYQKTAGAPADLLDATTDINEFPEHWRFRRQPISVAHRVLALVAHDYDNDGLNDIIYAGIPAEIVFVRQSSPGTFEVARRHRMRNLAANRSAFAVENIVGDAKPELISIVDGEIVIWPLIGDQLGPETRLSAGDDLVAMQVADFDGDGGLDIAGVLPDSPVPVRIWLSAIDHGQRRLGAQLRFEMPALMEMATVHLPNRAAGLLAVIERASKRIVLYGLDNERIMASGDRDAPVEVIAFSDAGSRERSLSVIDLDGNGLLDVVATDTNANTLVVYPQISEKGMQTGSPYPSLAKVTYLASGNVDADPMAELFVLSEEEGVVGRIDVSADLDLPFPSPISIPEGYTPVALNLVDLHDGPHLAVIAKSGREYMVFLRDMQGNDKLVDLGSLSRAPETIVALDADQDGRTDLLLFTRDKPMTMLHASADGQFELLESKTMGQFGLVQAAGSENTAVHDIDGDGKDELLIADANYVRAVRFETEPPAGSSPGWQVVEQINARDASSKLVSLTSLRDRLVVADQENNRLVMMERSGPRWREGDSVNVHGFDFSTIHTGAFMGDSRSSILAAGQDGFGVIPLEGDYHVLREFATWRTGEEQRRQHELTAGDLNGDGFMDMVSLDAGEQMCEIFTFSEAGHMHYATGFQVFESRMFSGGDAREYEPSEVHIDDVTGDGANDLILLTHDRVIIYPQMVR